MTNAEAIERLINNRDANLRYIENYTHHPSEYIGSEASRQVSLRFWRGEADAFDISIAAIRKTEE